MCGCAGNSTQNQGNIPMIDLSQEYPERKISLQELGGEIEYIPLETADDVLLDQNAKIVLVSDKHIIISNNDFSGDIFIFGRDGKIISHFNHIGQSGEEYTQLRQLIFDEKNKNFLCLLSIKFLFIPRKENTNVPFHFPKK
jgi:hypothetical protein